MPVRLINVKTEQAGPEQVRDVVDAIRGAQLVALPTETVYGLAADPDNPAGIARLRAVKDRTSEHVFTHAIASARYVTALAPTPPATARRLMKRYWPGPLTLIVAGHQEATVGLRVPAHEFTRRVLAEFPRGLLLTSANRTGGEPLVTPEEIADQLPEIDILVDGGPPPLAEASAVVRCVGTAVEVLREGTLKRDELLRAAATTVLFVCTGNTCRSPLAAALARHKVADALGLDESELLARGLYITSAGTMAPAGVTASPNSVDAAAEIGLDLSDHSSRPLTPDLFDGLGHAYALSRSHLDALRAVIPELADRMGLLDPSGRDISDPFGQDLTAYRATRDAIGRALDARLPEILALLETDE